MIGVLPRHSLLAWEPADETHTYPPTTDPARRYQRDGTWPAGVSARLACEKPRAPGYAEVVYLHRAVRRVQPHRQLRYEARSAGRIARTIQTHRDQRSRHSDL